MAGYKATALAALFFCISGVGVGCQCCHVLLQIRSLHDHTARLLTFEATAIAAPERLLKQMYVQALQVCMLVGMHNRPL
jgi:hypothetical protein